MKFEKYIDLFVLVWIVFKSTTLAPALLVDHWVVWNIGQGQWVTHVTNEVCRHYDMGGELGSIRRIQRRLNPLCFGRMNEVVLSHWDFDHYSNIVPFARSFPNVCWLSQPALFEVKKTAQAVLDLKLRPCQSQSSLVASAQFDFWKPERFETSNETSGVYQDHEFLIPGDSPIVSEKVWISRLRNLNQIKILVLGHHGSRTSTGDLLLDHLPQLQTAIASARYAKYHHPNSFTLLRLERHAVPVLRTEDWGDINY